jgi:hypothetical protein
VAIASLSTRTGAAPLATRSPAPTPRAGLQVRAHEQGGQYKVISTGVQTTVPAGLVLARALRRRGPASHWRFHCERKSNGGARGGGGGGRGGRGGGNGGRGNRTATVVVAKVQADVAAAVTAATMAAAEAKVVVVHASDPASAAPAMTAALRTRRSLVRQCLRVGSRHHGDDSEGGEEVVRRQWLQQQHLRG